MLLLYHQFLHFIFLSIQKEFTQNTNNLVPEQKHGMSQHNLFVDIVNNYAKISQQKKIIATHKKTFDRN